MAGRAVPLSRQARPSGAAPRLVGREAERGVIARVVEGVQAGQGAVVIVSGEPGIGKSALLAWTAWRAAQAGVKVLEAAATAPAVPFDLLVRALAPPERGAPSAARQLAIGSTPLDFIQHGDEPMQRHVDMLADGYEQAALAQPTIVVLDDLDRADAASCVGSVVIARRAALVGYAAVLAWRSPPADPAFARTAAALTSAADHTLALGPLSAASMAELVAAVAGVLPTPALLERLAAASGNPLLVLHLAELATAVDHGPVHSPSEALIANTIGRLGADDVDTLELLRVASAFSSELDLGDLAAAMRRSVSSLIDPLARARAARLLEADGPTMRFTHDLLRQALYEAMDPPVRVALHLDIARALQAAGVPASRVAPHLVAGVTPGNAECVAVLEQAALSLMPGAPAVAAGYLGRAAEMTAPNRTRDRLATEQARALCWSGHVTKAGAVAGEILARPHDPSLDPVLGFVTLRDHCLAGRLDAALDTAAVLADALAANPLMLAQLAKAQVYAGDLAGAEQRATRAIELSSRSGDESGLVLACSVLAAIRSRQCRFAESLELSDRAVRLADASPNGGLHHQYPYVFRVSILGLAGCDDAASAALARAEEVAVSIGSATPLANVLRAALRFRRGDWNDVGAETQAEVTHGEEFGARLGVAWAHALDGHVALHRGRPGRAAGAFEQSAIARRTASASLGGEWLAWGQALLPATGGDRAATLQALAKLAEAADAAGALATVALVAPDLVREATWAGRTDIATRVVERCREIARVAARELYDVIHLRCHGLATGDADALAEAAARTGSLGRPLDAATAAHDAAVAMAGRDTSRASALLHDALDRYDALDAQLWIDRARADARRLHLKLPAHRRPRPSHGWPSLTPTERLVAAAVAEGLANAAIATRLGISKRTVEAHLRNIFHKLDATSRLAVATMVNRDRPDLRY
jgi:DNA-binding NarL/FixJ family response regulator